MATPAAVPWIQYDEPVVAEAEPNGIADVANRPLKFILEQSDFPLTGDFPGFLVRYVGSATPEGTQTAGIASAFLDLVGPGLYIKTTPTGNTGWVQIGGYQPVVVDSDADFIPKVVTVSPPLLDNSIIFQVADPAICINPTPGVDPDATGTETLRVFGGISSFIAATNRSFGDGNSVDNRTGWFLAGFDLTVASGANNSGFALGSTITINSPACAVGSSITVGTGYNFTHQIFGSSITVGTGGGGSSGGNVYVGSGIADGGGNTGLCVYVGASMNITGLGINVVVGHNIVIDNANSVQLFGSGQNVSSGVSRGVSVGGGNTLAHSACIVLGDGHTTTAANQCWIGGTLGDGITTMIIGEGNTNAAPAALTIRMTNGVGTDIVGANLTFISSRATGNAASGSIIFQVGDAGSTGTTLQTATTKFTIAPTLLRSAVKMIIGDAAASALNTFGLVIDQEAADDQALTVKSSDVNHGMTTIADADAYCAFSKVSPTGGGVLIDGVTTATTGVVLRGCAATASTTKSTAAAGAVDMRGSFQSGTGLTALGANENILTIRSHTTTRFILDADGDSHQDVGTAWTNFDAHDDIALLNTLSAHVTRRDDPLRSAFTKWLAGSRDELERLKLVTFNEDGHHFVNMSRLTMLHTGAIRQLGEQFNRIEAALQRLIPAET